MRLERYLSPRFAPLACEVAFRLRLAWPYHVRWLADRLGDSSCDKKFGIASAKRQSLAKLGLELPDCADYQPVSYVDFQKFFESMPIGSNDVLLDFGSGMGRALCLAATYPFRSVIGVEMSPELCAIARRNIERVKPKLVCPDVRVINGNAVEYEISPDVTVFYFFNPFGGRVLAAVLQNIASSLRRAPRQVRVLFSGTSSTQGFREQAGSQAWLTLCSERILPTGTVGLVYRNTDWIA